MDAPLGRARHFRRFGKKMKSSHGVLLIGWFCPFAQRARIASHPSLTKLSIDVDTKGADLDREVNPRFMLKSSRLVQLTPPGARKVSVPTLRMDDATSINESIDVCVALLQPVSEEEERQARMWDELLCSKSFYGTLSPKSHAEVFEQWKNGFGVLEKALQERQFLSGDAIGVSDCVVFPFVLRAVRLKLFEHWGHVVPASASVERWLSAMLATEAVQRTLPADIERLGTVYHAYYEGPGLVGLIPKDESNPEDLSLPEELRSKFNKG